MDANTQLELRNSLRADLPNGVVLTPHGISSTDGKLAVEAHGLGTTNDG